MVSFLIPTYNFNCLSLVRDLHAQCELLIATDPSFAYEIIVADDGSPDVSVVEGLATGVRNLGSGHVKLLPLLKNIGLAAVRNVLVRAAKGEWVVFIDSDAAIMTPNFVSNYWQHRNVASAIVGGISNTQLMPRGHNFRMPDRKSVV